MKMRISLTQKGDDIKGKIELPADPAFVLEGLTVAIEAFANQSGVPVKEVLEDVWTVYTRSLQ